MGALKTAGLAAAAAAVAGGAVAAALLLGGGGAAPSHEPAAPLAVRAGFDRAVVQFGDPVTARVVVVLDRDAVRTQTLRVGDDLAPFTPLAAPVTTRTRAGRLETVTVAQRVACLTEPCLASRLRLPRVRVSAAGRAGGVATATAPWRTPRLRGRVTAADLARTNPPFGADTSPGAPAYRVAPGAAATALDAVAALAAAGAAALLALEAVAVVRRRRRAVAGDELARALRLVREAETRPAHDRRRALALLARLLRNRDGELGRTASDLAWSEPAPEPQAVVALVARVEEERTR
jgi:hypothetical protein